MNTAVIVGSSRGLGRALVAEHRRRGWRVIGTVRDAAPGPDTEVLDVTDGAGIDALHARLPHPIDRLFVVAGVIGPDGAVGYVEPGPFADTMLTNVLGPLRVVDRLADLVTDTGLIAVMSSRQGSIALNDDGGNEVYRISKSALNMGMRSLVVRRADRRTWLAINPGYVRTDMTGDDAALSIEQSVPRLVDLLDNRSGATGLEFLDVTGDRIPW